MRRMELVKIMFVAALLSTAVLAGGCGGRSSGGVAAQPPASPEDRGTLKLTNVPAKTIITIDGQQHAAATGTVTFDLAPGVHAVAVSRAGYVAANSADLAQTPIAIGQTTEKTLSFAREEIPLPDDWVEETPARIAEAPEEDKPTAPSAP